MITDHLKDQNDALKSLVTLRKHKNALSAEKTRSQMSPNELVEDLYNYRELVMTADIADLPRIDKQIGITVQLLRKCMPDLKAVEVKTQEAIINMNHKIEFPTSSEVVSCET